MRSATPLICVAGRAVMPRKTGTRAPKTLMMGLLASTLSSSSTRLIFCCVAPRGPVALAEDVGERPEHRPGRLAEADDPDDLEAGQVHAFGTKVQHAPLALELAREQARHGYVLERREINFPRQLLQRPGVRIRGHRSD